MGTYEKRRAGEVVTLDTRGESHDGLDKNKRYSQIIECFLTYPEIPSLFMDFHTDISDTIQPYILSRVSVIVLYPCDG